MLWIDRLFDLLFWPFRTLPLVFSLAAFSLLTAVLALIAFRYVSNQRAIRKAKDSVEARLLEIRLFREQPRVVVNAYGRLLVGVLRYLGHCGRPVIVMAIPLLIIFVQLDKRLSYAPLRPGDQFLLAAKLSNGAALESVALRLPDALALTAPPVHIGREKEVDWRIEARASGRFSPSIIAAGDAVTKQIEVSSHLARVWPKRGRPGMQQRLWDSAEAPLPAGGPVQSIDVRYTARSLTLWGFNVPWVAAFVAMMIVEMLLLRGVLRAEI